MVGDKRKFAQIWWYKTNSFLIFPLSFVPKKFRHENSVCSVHGEDIKVVKISENREVLEKAIDERNPNSKLDENNLPASGINSKFIQLISKSNKRKASTDLASESPIFKKKRLTSGKSTEGNDENHGFSLQSPHHPAKSSNNNSNNNNLSDSYNLLDLSTSHHQEIIDPTQPRPITNIQTNESSTTAIIYQQPYPTMVEMSSQYLQEQNFPLEEISTANWASHASSSQQQNFPPEVSATHWTSLDQASNQHVPLQIETPPSASTSSYQTSSQHAPLQIETPPSVSTSSYQTSSQHVPLQIETPPSASTSSYQTSSQHGPLSIETPPLASTSSYQTSSQHGPLSIETPPLASTSSYQTSSQHVLPSQTRHSDINELSSSTDSSENEEGGVINEVVTTTHTGKVTLDKVKMLKHIYKAFKHRYVQEQKQENKEQNQFEMSENYLRPADNMTELSPGQGFYLPNEMMTLIILTYNEEQDWRIFVREVLIQVYGKSIIHFSARGKKGRPGINKKLFNSIYEWVKSRHPDAKKGDIIHYINQIITNKRSYAKIKKQKK